MQILGGRGLGEEREEGGGGGGGSVRGGDECIGLPLPYDGLPLDLMMVFPYSMDLMMVFPYLWIL